MSFATSFFTRNQDVITAVVVMVLAFALLVAITRRARRVPWLDATSTVGLSRESITRLRFVRRLIEAAIILIAAAIAMSQFGSLDGIGRTLLTSSAITAAIVGFAARQSLANVIAGVMLAITQPLRIGDLVTVGGETGTVEDVGLVYTWLRTGTDTRILIPNELLASSILRNDAIRSNTVATEASVWIGIDCDESRALAALAAIAASCRIEEVTAAGIRLVVTGQPVVPDERVAREADLRRDALRVLREIGLRSAPSD